MSRIFTKAQIERSVCQDSFYQFFLRFWSVLCSEPLSQNWHIKFICDELQIIAERVFRRQPKEYDLVINISPGSTKSIIVSEMFPAWCWCRDPSLRFICASYGYMLSIDLSKKCRRIVTSEKYQTLFPEVRFAGEGTELLETVSGGMRLAGSVSGGGVTGLHGHFQLIDDPVKPDETMSELVMKQVTDYFDITLPSRMVDKRITPLVLIMQRLHQYDPTPHILNRDVPTKHICLPAELTPDVKPPELKEKYVDGLFDPVRLGREAIAQAKVAGEFAYASQYLQTPIPAGGGMFKVQNIQIVDERLDLEKKPAQLVRAWDKANTADGGCYTVGVLLAKTGDGTFWVLDVVRGQWEVSQRELKIQECAWRDGKNTLIIVEQEPGSGGKESAQATARRLAGYKVRLDKPSGDKVQRADPAAYQVNAGNVKMLRALWNKDFLEELAYFPNSRYKDQVDAFSAAFSALTRSVHIGGLGLGDGNPAGLDSKIGGGLGDERDVLANRQQLARALVGSRINPPQIWGGS